MSANNMWVKTHEALNNFIQKLTCTKCQKKFDEPNQFLNCGHFACADCIGTDTECLECKMPGEVSDICFDQTISDLLQNIDIIAEAVNFSLDNEKENFNSEDSTITRSSKRNLKNDLRKKKNENSSSEDSTITKISKLQLKRNLRQQISENSNSEGSTIIEISKLKLKSDLRQKKNENFNSEDSAMAKSSKSNIKHDKTVKTTRKVLRSNKVNKLDTSVAESISSKITNKSKTSNSVPKYINKKNRKGETPLHVACRMNNEERVKKLLEAGANPNTKDFAGWTPLQESTSYGFFKIVATLLKAGALTDMHGYDNRTALHEAVLNDNYEIASLLIHLNSSTKVFDNLGKNPEDYCASKQMVDLFSELQDSTDKKSETCSETHKSINQSLISLNEESKIILYGSDLSLKNRKILFNLGIEKKLKVVNTFSPTVSHVIIDDPFDTNYIKPTIDILLTVLHGKWLVSSDCLAILQESDNITMNDFNIFEVNPSHLEDALVRSRENIIKQNPRLFNNCQFYFALQNFDSIMYDAMEVTKDNLVKIVSAGDGVTLKREPKPEDIQGLLSPFHVAHDPKHSLHKCTHYVIHFDTECNATSNRIIYNMPFLKTLPFMWFVESILRFKLIDPVDLGLFHNS